MVGERIRRARLSRDLSLVDVASEAQISAATLSRIETGKQGIDLELFVALAKVLHVAPHELLRDGSDGDSNPDIAGQLAGMRASARARVWQELAASRRAQQSARKTDLHDLADQVDELVAQIDFLREEIATVRAQLKRGK